MERPRGELPEAGVGAEGDWAGGLPPVLGPRTDRDITEAVETALFLEPEVDLSHFIVDTKNGVVRLRGRVSSPREKELAIQAARDVAGVVEVVDEIEVVPTSPSTE